MSKPKAVAVVGPTSSGKTSLAIAIAKYFGGEVISADSRQVYRGLDIGTGKVTEDEMDGIPHHLINVADPKDNYTAAEFELDASAAIMDIRSRDKLPVVAGGTFFYLDMLRGIHSAPPVAPDWDFRLKLSSLSNDELFNSIEDKDPDRAETIDRHNRPRLIRALEIIESLGHVPKPTAADSPYEWLVIGIDLDRVRLAEKIHRRLQERTDSGLVDEVKKLHDEGVSFDRLEELGLEYKLVSKYLQQEIKHDELLDQLFTKNKQYAKRQMTWLRRDKEIKWFQPEETEQVLETINDFLSN